MGHPLSVSNNVVVPQAKGMLLVRVWGNVLRVTDPRSAEGHGASARPCRDPASGIQSHR